MPSSAEAKVAAGCPSLARFAFEWSRFNAFSAAGDAVRRPGLGFLDSSLFRCEDPNYEGWISLDFLGFSRPNLDLSVGYAV
jgi:hypothetical protein